MSALDAAMQFALPGEKFLTQAVIRPDEKINTKEAFESAAMQRYPTFELRFDYEHLVYGDKVVSSEDFAYRCTDLPRGQGIAVSVFGKKKACADTVEGGET